MESESTALPLGYTPTREMGWIVGFEPTHNGATTRCLNHLTIPTAFDGAEDFSPKRLISIHVIGVECQPFEEEKLRNLSFGVYCGGDTRI